MLQYDGVLRHVCLCPKLSKFVVCACSCSRKCLGISTKICNCGLGLGLEGVVLEHIPGFVTRVHWSNECDTSLRQTNQLLQSHPRAVEHFNGEHDPWHRHRSEFHWTTNSAHPIRFWVTLRALQIIIIIIIKHVVTYPTIQFFYGQLETGTTPHNASLQLYQLVNSKAKLIHISQLSIVAHRTILPHITVKSLCS